MNFDTNVIGQPVARAAHTYTIKAPCTIAYHTSVTTALLTHWRVSADDNSRLFLVTHSPGSYIRYHYM